MSVEAGALPKVSEATRQTPAANKESLAEQRWLAWLAIMIPEANWFGSVIFATDDSSPELKTFSVWPEFVTPASSCITLAIRATRTQRVSYVANADSAVLAVPMKAGHGRSTRVLLVAGDAFSEARRQTIIRLGRWAADAAPSRQDPSAPAQQSLERLAEITLDAATRNGSSTAVAFAIVNAVHRLCGCRRVTLGLMSARQIRILAMSGQSQVDERRTLLRGLKCVMLESQALGVSQLLTNEDQALPAHTEHLTSQGGMPLLSIPVVINAMTTVLIVLERPVGQPFDSDQRATVEQLLQRPLKLLSLLHEQHLSLRQRLRCHAEKFRQLWQQPRRLSLRTGIRTLACVLALVSLVVPVSQRITTRAVIEAADLQVVVAPWAGYLKSSHVRAGDRVTKGQLLATLDAQDIELEIDKYHSESLRNDDELARALATHDRQELSRLRAESVRIEVESAQASRQMQRSNLRAPFAGVVLKGDPGQSLGAPVTEGEVLFELASSDAYRLSIEVDEHDVGLVKPGQKAWVRMAAMPETRWQATLDTLIPVAVSRQGKSLFRLPASLEGANDSLKPGMQGVARLQVGYQPVFWAYTRNLRLRLRLLAWKLGIGK